MFNRGKYGEILPPPLWVGYSLQDTLDAFTETAGIDTPQRGRGLLGVINLSLIHLQQGLLQKTFIGELIENTTAQQLYHRVVIMGEPMSLRPFSMERLQFKTFEPLLQRKDQANHWLVCGQDIVCSPLKVMEVAQSIYFKKSKNEHDLLTQWLQRQPVNMTLKHYVWSGELEQSYTVFLYEGYVLQRLGSHGYYYLTTPTGDVMFKASTPRQSISYALHLIKNKTDVIFSFEDVIRSFDVSSVDDIENLCSQLSFEVVTYKDVEVKKKSDTEVLFKFDGNYYLLMHHSNHIVLHQKASQWKKTVTVTSWDYNQRMMIAVAWAVFLIKGKR